MSITKCRIINFLTTAIFIAAYANASEYILQNVLANTVEEPALLEFCSDCPNIIFESETQDQEELDDLFVNYFNFKVLDGVKYVIRPIDWDTHGKNVKTGGRDATEMILCLDGYLRGNDRSLGVVRAPSEEEEQLRSGKACAKNANASL